MDAKRSSLRRKQLDEQLRGVARVIPPAPPKGGWIHAMREALGMGIESFAKRLGISRQAAYKLESAEESGSITLKRLRSAADAVDCDVAVFLIPRKPLEKIVEEQATSTAYHLVARVGHSMALEAQGLPPGQLANMVRETAKEMIQRGDPKIWE